MEVSRTLCYPKKDCSLSWKVKPFYWGHERWDNQMPSKLFLWTFEIFLPLVKVMFFIGIFVGAYQRWKLWAFCPRLLLLAILATKTNGASYVIWSLSLSSLCHPSPPHASTRSPEAIFLAPRCGNKGSYSRRRLLAREVRVYTPGGRC